MPRILISISCNGHTYNSRVYELSPVPNVEILVGSAQCCRIVLPEMREIAPVHASIAWTPQGFILTDLSSSVSQPPYGAVPSRVPMPLLPGVELRLGVVTFLLEPEATPRPMYQLPTNYAAVPPMQVQYVPVVIVDRSSREERPVKKTSKFKQKEASLLLARFHRHKMHNAYLWSLLWAFFSLLLLASVICLAMRSFFPDVVKQGDRFFENFVKEQRQNQ